MESYEVFTGRWNNFSLSHTGQITLSDLFGGVLVGAVSTFIGIAGSQLWSIFAFAIYYCRARPGARDGTHHYQQAAYRNISSPLGITWSLLKGTAVYSGRKSWWHFRRHTTAYTTRRKRRLLLFALVPIVVWALYTAAGPASPLLITHAAYKSNDVKIRPKNCGFEQWDPSWQGEMAFQQYNQHIATEALSYVNSCYNSSTDLSCTVLPQQRLNYGVYETTTCPFGSFCKTPALIMDTGWMDSLGDFGINAKEEDRVQIRKQATCAVLDVGEVTTMVSIGNDLYRYEYNFGPVAGLSDNYTAYVVERQAPDYVGYTIQPYYAYEGAQNDWEPIADFSPVGFDVSLFNIQFGVMTYETPVTDPLFAATRSIPNDKIYTYNEPAGLVACQDRWQIQDTTGSLQTDLSSIRQVAAEIESLDFNDAQLATAFRFSLPGSQSEMYNAVNGLGVAALKAQINAFSTVSTGLPDNQWQIELQGWFDTCLAMLQLKVVSFAYKDDSQLIPGLRLQLNVTATGGRNEANELHKMCHEQKIRNIAHYQTFSVWGILLIGCVGGCIIVISLAMESLYDMGWTLKNKIGRKSGENPRLIQWRLESLPHLQRRAFQNAGQGHWDRCDDDIPVLQDRVELLECGDRGSGVRMYRRVSDEEEAMDGGEGQGAANGAMKAAHLASTVESVTQPSDVGGQAGDLGHMQTLSTEYNVSQLQESNSERVAE